MNIDSVEIEKLKRELVRGRRILITAHQRPDPDAVGSVLAIREALESLGCLPVPVLEDDVPSRCHFMSGSDTIQRPSAYDSDPKFDCVIVVDSGSLNRIGLVETLIAKNAVIINLDHHRSNDKFGAINIVHPRSSASGELLYFLFRELGVTITPTIATNLFAGVLTDTGRFRHSNTTSVALHVAADLTANGADASYITEQLYYGIPAQDIYSMSKILSSLELFGNGKISTMLVPLDQVVEDPDNVADLARAIRGVEVAALFSEMTDGRIRISLRSNSTVNVSELASRFGGGGHDRAAGFRMKGSLADVRKQVLPALLEAVGENK